MAALPTKVGAGFEEAEKSNSQLKNHTSIEDCGQRRKAADDHLVVADDIRRVLISITKRNAVHFEKVVARTQKEGERNCNDKKDNSGSHV